MKAITLWRPWSDAIAHGPKRVENRPWAPWPGTLGTVIAIHAGAKYAARAFAGMPAGYTPPAKDQSPRGIVATARLVGYLDFRDSESPKWEALPRVETTVNALDQDPWWVGPVGWLLEDVMPLPTPIACSGALGMWEVPEDVEAAIVRQYLGVTS